MRYLWDLLWDITQVVMNHKQQTHVFLGYTVMGYVTYIIDLMCFGCV